MPMQKARQFSFHPRYYNPEEDEAENHPRIRFKRLLRSPKPQKKSVRRYLILAIGLIFFIWYMHRVQEQQPIQIEDIRIEDITPED